MHWLMRMTIIDDNNINLLIQLGREIYKEVFPMEKQEGGIPGYGG